MKLTQPLPILFVLGLQLSLAQRLSNQQVLVATSVLKSKLTAAASVSESSELFDQLKEEHKIVAVIEVKNYLKYPLTEAYGFSYKSYGDILDNPGLADRVDPGTSQAFVTVAKGNSKGVSGTLSYKVDTEDQTYYVTIMWSVPYKFLFYKPHVAVGISTHLRSAQESFTEMYNSNKPTWFDRQTGRYWANFKTPLHNLVVVGDMSPSKSYQPTFTLSVLSLSVEDLWTSAEAEAGNVFPPQVSMKAARSTKFWLFIGIVVAIVIFCLVVWVVYQSCCQSGSNARTNQGLDNLNNNNSNSNSNSNDTLRVDTAMVAPLLKNNPKKMTDL